MSTKPYRFQREDALKVEKHNGRALVAYDPGLGKTFFSLYYRDQYLGNVRTLVICPAGIKQQWIEQAEEHFGLRGVVLNGLSCPKHADPRAAKLMVIGYNCLTNQRDRRRRTWLNFLRDKFRPQLVIVDESQWIQQTGGVWSRNVRNVCQWTESVLCLSGTPFTCVPTQLFSSINLLWPKKFPAFFPFAWKYTRPKKVYGQWKFTGLKNAKRLNLVLRRCGMVRRRLRDVITDLPPKRRQVVKVEIRGRAEYDHALSDFADWLYSHKNKVFRSAKAEALVKGTYLLGLLAKLKYKAVRDWIDNFLVDSDGKLVVFARHREFLEKLHAGYKTSVLIYGGKTHDDRHRAKRKFITDPRCRILFGNERAAGVGLDGLQKACSTVAICEMGWSQAGPLQCEGRVDRIGQKLPVMSYWLIADDTIEVKLAQILQERQGDFDAIFDGKEHDKSSLDVFDLFVKALMKERKMS